MRSFCALTLVLGVMLASAPAEARLFAPESFTLANGLQVIVVPNHRAPVVSQMLWYKVGAADEPRGKSGIAHYLEHLMFKGTPSVPAGEFSKIVAREGGRDNAFTAWDYTAYFQTVAADRLNMVMQMEADRMANLALSDEKTRPELQVVLSERQQRTDNDPQGKFREQMDAVTFVHHPYGQPIIGWAQEIAALTTQDAVDFYKAWYVPNNAVLIVSGDVTRDQVMAAASATYGRIPARELPLRRRVVEPPAVAERRIVMRDADVRQPVIQRSYSAPSYRTAAGAGDPYALEVLAEILAGGEVGRLYKDLVIDRKLAAGVDADYEPSSLDRTSFTFALTPQPGVAPEKLEAAFDAVLAKLLTEGVTKQEVADATARLQRSAIFARDSLMAPGYVFGMALTTGQKIEDVEDWPERIGAVTQTRVNKAAHALLDDKDAVTGLLLPKGGGGHDFEASPADLAPAGGAVR